MNFMVGKKSPGVDEVERHVPTPLFLGVAVKWV